MHYVINNKKIHSNTAGIKDNDIINYEFMEYDYGEENTRMNNEQYSEYANNYIKKLDEGVKFMNMENDFLGKHIYIKYK